MTISLAHLWAAALLLLAVPCRGQVLTSPVPGAPVVAASSPSVVVGDLFIEDRLSLGGALSAARLGVRVSSRAETAFLVSGVDKTPFIAVSSAGALGFGMQPTHGLSVMGWPGSGPDSGLVLRAGGRASDKDQYSIAFGPYGGSGFRHALRARLGDGRSGNILDFLLFDARSMRPQQIGGLHALALQTRANGVGVQVMPAGYGDGDLVISDGVTKGRGTVHRREEVAPASRDSFESITYFGAEQKERAARDVAAMRYVLSGSGLQPVYAKTSETVRRRDGFVSLDARVLNAEMSAQAIMRTLRELDGEVGALEVAK